MVDAVSQVRRSLLISFGFLILIMLALVANAWWDRVQARAQVKDILQRPVQKLQLANAISQAAADRVALLYQAAHTEDPFARDKLIQRFHADARRIMAAREGFDRLGSADDELRALEASYTLRNEMYQIQRNIVDLLETDQLDAALKAIQAYAVPKREAVKRSLDRVVDIQQEAIARAVRKMDAHSHASEQRFFGMLLAAIWLSLIIAAYVTGQTLKAHKASLEASKRAREMANSKSNFLANMSHEIRTPLNAIVGTAELLKETRIDKEQGEYLAILRNSASALLNLINDILDFSKADAGQIKLENTRFAMADLVHESVNSKAVDIYAKELDFSVYIDPKLEEYYRGDAWRLRQVITNLLSNAEKFTAYGEISLRVLAVKSDQNRVRIEVHDSGIGIQKDHQEALFDAFTQADDSTTRRYGGTGLGLAICRKIVRAMNGDISIDSDFGRGSIFRFEVELEAIREETQNRQPLQGQRILLVCSNLVNQMHYTGLIETQGAQVLVANDADSAQNMVCQANTTDSETCCEQSISQFVISLQLGEAASQPLIEALHTRCPDTPITVLAPIGKNNPALPANCRLFTLPCHPRELIKALKQHPKTNNHQPSDTRPDKTGHQFSDTFASDYPLRILIAEDNPINQMVLKTMLERLGYHIALANDGQQAVESCRTQAFDLILMDVQMPNMDGVEATQRLKRELSAARRPYIIAVTAHAMAGDRERYLAAGMDDYLSKPVSADNLLDKLMQCPVLACADPPSPGQTQVRNPEATGNDTLQGALQAIDGQYIATGQLHKLLAISGEADMMNMIDQFLSRTWQSVPAIGKSLRAADASSLRKHCRELRDEARSIAAAPLAECCSEMLQATKSGRLDALDPLHQRLQCVAEGTLAELKRIRHPE